MRKIKTILGIVFSLAIVTTMNTTVFAANDSGIPDVEEYIYENV